MAATLGSLIDTVRHRLSGFDNTREGVAALTSSITSSATALPVDDVSDASEGIAEIGMEIVRVKGVEGNTLVLYPFGRGYRGTTAQAHSVGAEVTLNPSWPVAAIAREINAVLNEIYPRIYGIDSYEGLTNSEGEHALPVDAIGVISVWVLDSADIMGWKRVNHWSFDRHASDTNLNLRLPRIPTGMRYRVVYAKRPGQFDLTDGLEQEFADTTGLDERLTELVLLGVVAHMTPYVDVSRLPYTATAVREQGEASPPNAGASAARLLVTLYQQQLEQEALILGRENPITRHRTVS